MQITSKPTAVFASLALAASMILGGAGIANAQGSAEGSLLPEGPDFELSVEGDAESVSGELVNNTEAAVTCDVEVMDGEGMGAIEDTLTEDDSLSYDDARAQHEEDVALSDADGMNASADGVAVEDTEVAVFA